MDQCEPSVEAGTSFHQDLMREVNLRIFEIGSRLSQADDQYTFFCECSDPHCDRTIRLELHRFDPTMPAGALLAHVPHGEQEPLT